MSKTKMDNTFEVAFVEKYIDSTIRQQNKCLDKYVN